MSAAYRIDPDVPVRGEILRCAAAQLDRAVAELTEGFEVDPEAAVHGARKAVKKERSLLRLARGSIGGHQRRSQNRALRHAARTLSAARDSEAMLQTLDELAERYAGQLPERTFDAVRAPLRDQHDREREQLLGTDLPARAAADLAAVRDRIEQWELTERGWRALEDGLERAYRDGRRTFHRARDHRSGVIWHNWRRRVKDLWYQERLLSEVAGPACAGQAKDAHRLADLLGDDHDLVVLRDALIGAANDVPADVAHVPADVEAIVELIEHRQQELRRRALQLGARVYAEKPKPFMRRMRAMWRAGRDQEAAAADQRPAELAQATRTPHVV
jgi:CHAD domain-containing protein